MMLSLKRRDLESVNIGAPKHRIAKSVSREYVGEKRRFVTALADTKNLGGGEGEEGEKVKMGMDER